jgi:hypothetical protein
MVTVTGSCDVPERARSGWLADELRPATQRCNPNWIREGARQRVRTRGSEAGGQSRVGPPVKRVYDRRLPIYPFADVRPWGLP